MVCDVPRRIDLHIHSTASDGTWTPQEILAQADALQLGAISITDHDTVRGVKEAIDSGIPPSFEFLTGIEISSNPPSLFPFPDTLHILGYHIDTDNADLDKALGKLRRARQDRNPGIIRRLGTLGIDLSLQEVRESAGAGQIGRPHIARCMVEKGVVRSIHDAFDLYLGRGKPAYVDKYRVESASAIQLILNAAGIPVLAHPGLLKTDGPNDLTSLVAGLKEMGLMGIEAYYPGHLPAQTAGIIELAERYDLLVTGGSDFHGDMYPDIRMGTGRGDLCVPFDLYEKLVRSMNT